MEKEKKTILSAIKPTGTLNLGGYLGAMKNWVALQDESNLLYRRSSRSDHKNRTRDSP